MKTVAPLVVLAALVLTACNAPQTVENAPGPTATVRILLIATDPATVVRAAGKPQLVEFFAFW